MTQVFMGLMYYLLGSGAQGDADIKFIKEKLVDPFASGVAALESYKQNKLSIFRGIKKSIKGNPELKLNKQNRTGFTKSASQYSVMSILNLGTNNYIVTGEMSN